MLRQEVEGLVIMALLIGSLVASDRGHPQMSSFMTIIALAITIVALGRVRVRG